MRNKEMLNQSRNRAGLIRIPSDFTVACGIFKIQVADVLQVFINHLTIFDSASPVAVLGYTEATQIISSYVREKGAAEKPSMALRNCLVEVNPAINGIFQEANDFERDIDQRRKRTSGYVAHIFNVMERVHTPVDGIYFSDLSHIHFTKDFIVLCELHNCYPEEFLEYFMNNVSLAETYARRGLKMEWNTASFSLFISIENGLGRDGSDIAFLTDKERDFFERMEELQLELFIVRNLQQRIDLLREFHLAHYLEMNPN